jgi:polyhydroxyalkanoate synthesis regulator phasin
MSTEYSEPKKPHIHNPLDEVRKMTDALNASQKKEAQLLTQANVKRLGERVDALEANLSALTASFKEFKFSSKK